MAVHEDDVAVDGVGCGILKGADFEAFAGTQDGGDFER